MRVYFLRHQIAGVLHEYPFMEPPSADQIAAFSAITNEKSGAGWMKVVSFDAMSGGTVPGIPEKETERPLTSRALLAMLRADGRGHVANPVE